jgi:ABC-type nitrate/sulfonate/bicarbonate transport system permease component
MKRQEFIGVLIFLVSWEAFTVLVKSYFFPSLESIVSQSISKITLEVVSQNLGYTVAKTLISFLIGSVLGLMLGSIVSTNVKLIKYSLFTIDFMRSLPITVLFPIFMIVLGVNETSKVLVTSFGIFWIVLFGTIQSISTIEQVKVKYLRIHGANSWELFRHYIIFVLFQNWITTLKITLNLTLFITVTLEMFIGSEYGIGKAIVDAKNYYEIPVMYFWIIVAGLIGYLLNKLVVLVEGSFD